MIAFLTVEYEAINRDQLITFNAHLQTHNIMGNMTVGKDVAVLINEGKSHLQTHDKMGDMTVGKYVVMLINEGTYGQN